MTILYNLFAIIILLCFNSQYTVNDSSGATTITKWQDDKKGAVLLTFDDGNINQFQKAYQLWTALIFPELFLL